MLAHHCGSGPTDPQSQSLLMLHTAPVPEAGRPHRGCTISTSQNVHIKDSEGMHVSSGAHLDGFEAYFSAIWRGTKSNSTTRAPANIYILVTNKVVQLA